MSLQKLDGQVEDQTQSLAKQFHLALEQAQAQLLGQGGATSQDLGLDLGQLLALGGGTARIWRPWSCRPWASRRRLAILRRPWTRPTCRPWPARRPRQAQAGLADAAAQGAANSAASNNNPSVDNNASAGQTGLGGVQAATDRPVTQTQDGGGLNFFGQNQTGAAQEATAAQPTLPAYVVRQVGQQDGPDGHPRRE